MLVVSLILAFVLSLVSAQWEIIPQRYDGMSGYLSRSSHILPQNYQSLGFYNNPASQYQEQMINTHLNSLPGFSADLGPQFAQFGTQGLSNQFSPIMRSDIQSNIGYSNIDSLMGQRVSPQIGSMGIMNPIAQAGSSPLNPQLMPFGQFQTDSNQRMMSRESPTLSQAKPTKIIPPFMSGSTQEEQDKFYAIVQHPTWSSSEKELRIKELIQGMNTNTQNLYDETRRSWSSATAIKRQKVHQAVSEMSQEAQTLFQKVSALMTNPSLVENDRLQRIQELYSKIPDSIKKEFDSKLTDL